MLGKASPYPAACTRVGALPVDLAGRSRGMEPAGPARRRSACSCSIQGLCTPLPVLPLFAFYGATYAGSRSSGLRQQCRAGQLGGRSREHTPDAGRANTACRGYMQALESRLMLSPLLGVVTAQKPRRFADLAGFCILGSRQCVPESYHIESAISLNICLIISISAFCII